MNAASHDWAGLIRPLLAGGAMDTSTAYSVMDEVMTGNMDQVRLASLLTALATKGPSVDEVRGFADAMRDHALSADLPTDALDIVGTGGDGHHTVNVSTMAMLLLAASGVPMVKHGNRASTSACGSADLLEALGVRLDVDPQRATDIFHSLGVAFLFANHYHPSMRHAAPVRRSLAFPTVFNILGPLTNPARPRASAVGAANERHAELIAGVFAGRGQDAVVFRGRRCGLDEFSTCDTTQVWWVTSGEISTWDVDPVADFGCEPSTLEDLRGGSADDNAAVAREILAGDGPVAVRDAVCLNAAAGMVAFHGAGGEKDFTGALGAGLDRAREVLASGAGLDLLERWASATQRDFS
ncbi:MAG: anthranilate phosphoribosyltransferase [Actinomycetaceae bacterium]|nr:anthranilate phosphoribosyltransferase [Actinomycetaceae bacterium]